MFPKDTVLLAALGLEHHLFDISIWAFNHFGCDMYGL